MKLVVLRSERQVVRRGSPETGLEAGDLRSQHGAGSGSRVRETPPQFAANPRTTLADHYLQQFNTHYADRVIGNLRGEPAFCTACGDACEFCRKPYRRNCSRNIAAVIGFPDVLPYMLEDPRSFVPQTVPAHDVLLAIHIHEQILLECLQQCRSWGTRGVVVPLEAPDWISPATRTRARKICESAGVEIDFPKPLCAFKPPAGSVLAEFRRQFHIGYPEVAVQVEDGTITKADVKVSAACGSTYYIARWLVGRRLYEDLATEVISKRLHSFPCTASMERDPELEDDTPLHVAGQAHNRILASVKDTPAPHHDQVLSPLGIWVQKPVSRTDTMKNIERAKDLILEQLRAGKEVTLEQLRQAGPVTPAALHSALLLLKKEGRICIDRRRGEPDRIRAA
jgi:hypothetical protein